MLVYWYTVEPRLFQLQNPLSEEKIIESDFIRGKDHRKWSFQLPPVPISWNNRGSTVVKRGYNSYSNVMINE
jgi:hypothetical protein